MTPEEYIKAYTRGCSNVVDYSGISPDGIRYHEWLTPENALAAVELAREEIYKKLSRISMSSNPMDYVRGVGELMDELKKE